MSISARDIVNDVIEGLDDSLQPIDDKAVAVEDENKSEDVGDDAQVDTTDNDKSDGEDDSATDSEESGDGYTIDEVDDDSKDDEEENSEEPVKPQQQSQLPPDLQYVADNLKPLTVRGIIGDSEEVKEFTVYDPSQLPDGFKYTSDKEHDIAVKAFSNMENQAVQLRNDFLTQENAKATKAFKEAEERADWSDIASLQKSGDLAKFKLKPSDPKFDEDPTAQLIEKVLDFKDEINQKYLEESQNGAPYRHIGFEDAYRRYLKVNPVEAKSEAEEQEDKERKDLATRTRGGNGAEAKGAETKAPVLRNKRDIDAFIDTLDF